MNEQQKARALTDWCMKLPAFGPWRLARLEILSTVQPQQWPSARVELVHEHLGRLVKIATGAGPLDAAFNAISELVRVGASMTSLNVDYEPAANADGPPHVRVEVEAASNGSHYRGGARTGDLFVSAVAAFLDAAFQAAITERPGVARALPDFASTDALTSA